MTNGGKTLFWHDYETSGIDSRRDRPLQFAGLRTDLELNVIDDPVNLFCRPADDLLPHPDACMVTGISPQHARDHGVPEAEFSAAILDQLARPGTCGVGYNSLRFDDEFTRNLLYRNFADPYAREWQSGNSRWDLLDALRAAQALRPEGIEWPRDEAGVPSFRLERLTAANGIEHGDAHDALADVRATIDMARLLRAAQPRLYDYLFAQRAKRQVQGLIDLAGNTPLVHVSGRYPAVRNCLAVVAPVAMAPENPNGVLVYDLSVDPSTWRELDADGIAARIFTAMDELPEGVARIPLKMVRVNRCPVLVPLNVLRPVDARRLGIDLDACRRHLDALRASDGLAGRVRDAFARAALPPLTDPDLMIYAGGFFSDADRARMARLRRARPDELAGMPDEFDDPRVPEMLFRYRARNWPESLDDAERVRWDAFRGDRLLRGEGGVLTFDAFMARIGELRVEPGADAGRLALLDQLEAYGRDLVKGLD